MLKLDSGCGCKTDYTKNHYIEHIRKDQFYIKMHNTHENLCFQNLQTVQMSFTQQVIS